MRRRDLKPALLSALVFPGAGQFANRQPWRALAYLASTSALLVALCWRIWIEAVARLPQDPEALLDPALPTRLALEVQQASARFLAWTTAALVILWALSIADAWRSTRPRTSERARLKRSGGRTMRFCSECAAPLPSPPPVTCPACDTSHWLDSKPCAGALVTRDGRLLLVRRAHEPWRGLWDVPGGFCAWREHPRDTAVREVREETGLVIRTGAFIGMWIDSYAPSGADSEKVTLSIYFHATAVGAHEPRVDPNEVAEIAWFTPDGLPGDVAFPGHLPEVLAAWRASRREPSPGEVPEPRT